ncbi:hypothetical protein BDU57DRAFT_43877 [Ampelomyces quisqualis]|uniref:Uncharacterized protein n=1 Tax=Ampelomyces quisqualis TaxID=50730 RepID=A0A6A5QZN7_AMPQU|nr:hypothetical protein BDU57DRAFT_43877 [Ampelomyces quisqualis]
MIDFPWPTSGFMFLCSSWHSVVDMGCLWFGGTCSERSPGVPVFDHSVTKQCFWFWLLLSYASGVGVSYHLTTYFLLRALPQERFGGPLALVTVLLRSWSRHAESLPGLPWSLRIPCVRSLRTRLLKNMVYRRDSQQRPDFTSFRSRS